MRDFIGRRIFRTGSGLHRLGLWLCGLAGTWDSMTDDRKVAAHPGSRDGSDV